ncbi:hypothetical protein ABER60_00245 [Heyndrickxia coagulans]|uniref:hypothetical protein n=1 Tax=Heyndrickxia coagulans TaxID=1398 RepID=UPI003D22BC8E
MKSFVKLVNFEINRFAKIYWSLVAITILSQFTSVFLTVHRYISQANWDHISPVTAHCPTGIRKALWFDQLYRLLWYGLVHGADCALCSGHDVLYLPDLVQGLVWQAYVYLPAFHASC